MQRKKPASPLSQQVKGVFFITEGEGLHDKALELITSLDCTVLNDNVRSMMVKTTLANLQAIKSCWLSTTSSNARSQELKASFSRIMIGGRA